jgi:hypothetical protein
MVFSSQISQIFDLQVLQFGSVLQFFNVTSPSSLRRQLYFILLPLPFILVGANNPVLIVSAPCLFLRLLLPVFFLFYPIFDVSPSLTFGFLPTPWPPKSH